MMPGSLYIGLMSGTSTDGVDAVLADFSNLARPQIKAQASLPMPDALRREFLALNIAGSDELRRAALAGNALARLYAQAVQNLLDQSGLSPADILAIGAHGQTVRHDPAAGYTLQINAPALLAELSKIDVIADFRSRDIAAGGQGAPLVPAFHQCIFSCDYPRAILNLGGIGNVTLLSPAKAVRGFDTGPANVLLDLWCHQKTGQAYDKDGRWAASGTVHPQLLEALIASEPWFALPPPKSTGRDLFNWSWLQQRLLSFSDQALPDNDVQATLQSLTARTVADAINTHAPETRDVLVCGGGALNTALMRDLEHSLQRPVMPTSKLNVEVQLVEALAFAWLAWAHVNQHPAGLPAVTGASAPRVLGCRHPR
jgi:anhydro-N-acetylmuramic acid kinase